MRAIALFSGGLDSALAIKLIQEQNIEVEGVYIDVGFESNKQKIEYLSVDVFKTHSLELSLVYQEKFDDPKLLDIVLRDDILTLDFESLKKQIIKLLIPYYQNKIIELKTSNLDPVEKMHKLKLLNYKILQLKKGELVESDSTI